MVNGNQCTISACRPSRKARFLKKTYSNYQIIFKLANFLKIHKCAVLRNGPRE